MTVEEILQSCNGLTICEERSREQEYCELVFLNEEIDRWNAIFTRLLGPAIKPKGLQPTADDLSLTAAYGGITGGQVLFRKDFGSEIVLAMFWPWQNGSKVTLKVALLRRG